VITIPVSIAYMVMGEGRNDGKKRLYAACYDSHVHEISCNDTMWSEIDLGGPNMPYEMICVAVGDARNDGINRVYGGNLNAKIYEYLFDGINWTMDSIMINKSSILSIDIADGRNDGIKRLYTAPNSSVLTEATWNAGVWQISHFGNAPSTTYNSVCVGDVRNNDTNKVYGWVYYSIDKYRLYEWTYRSGWQLKLLDTCDGMLEYRMAVGDARNDGKNRLYTTTYDHLYETFLRVASGIPIQLSMVII